MRRFALLGIWAAATAVAVAVAWGGVQLVARQVVDPIPVALTETGSPATTQAPSSPAPSAVPPASAEEPPPGGQAETRTYQLRGGTVSVSFSPSAVTVVQATPRSGYSRKVEPEGDGIKVEFESDAHRSRLDAWWDGQPQAVTREDARD